MGKKKLGNRKINVVAKFNGRNRRLFSIVDDENGYVQIFLFAGPNAGLDETSNKITQNKYSIHLTEDNPTINVIKKTSLAHNTEDYVRYQRTSAIKSGKRFAPIFQLNYPALVSSYYDFTENSDGQVLLLTEYDYRCASLVIGVFVGARDAEFDVEDDDRFNVVEVTTRIFKIIIISSFIAGPSPNRSTTMDTITTKIPQAGARLAATSDSEFNPMQENRGGSPLETIEYYIFCLNQLKMNICKFSLEEFGADQEYVGLINEIHGDPGFRILGTQFQVPKIPDEWIEENAKTEQRE